MNITTTLISVAALAALAGCGTPAFDLQTAAASGAQVAADVSLNPDGSYHADRLLIAATTGATDDESDSSGGDADADTDNDNVECEDGVTPDGQACADDADGQEDGTDADADTSASSATATTTAFVRGTPTNLDGGTTYGLFGVSIDVGSSSVPAGVVRFDGDYTNGYLSANKATTTTGGLALGGSSAGITKTGPDRWSLSLLGQDIIVDSSTEIVPVSSPIAGDEDASSETDASDDADGVDCQQDGDHEGDNQGC
ncbi:MAG: hypothetical protein GXP62_19250 [Oligoflexia bacterium]|nr:hypothetical protein [Oligoflexia bacterium]